MPAPVSDFDEQTGVLIEQARSLPGGPIGARPAPYVGIGALLADWAGACPDKPWLTYYDSSGCAREYTRKQFYEAAGRVAGALAAGLGLRPGERVATMMTNSPEMVLVYFGTWLAGATVVPVNCGEDDARVRFLLENCEAKALFADPAQASRCAQLREGLPELQHLVQVGGNGAQGLIPYADLISGAVPTFGAPDPSADSECLIVYTSGTTGTPKGVVLEQYNLLADASSIAEWHRFGPSDRAMCVLPLHHVNGTVVTLMTPLCSGGSIVLNDRFRAQTFWKTLADERCTWVSVVPTVLAFLCERADDLSDFDLHAFRHFICGAGPLTVDLARRFDDMFGVRVVHGYGLSETTCYSCFLPVELDAAAYRHWMTECGFPSIGCPISANEMAIHNATGEPQPAETRGEIVVRGHNVMRGYYRRPDANRDTFAHGWFRSGDEGFYRVGPDGRRYFFITGRLKELIIRGGVNYSPFDIDEVLCAIPGVKAAMAVGFENDLYGEEVGAYVQLEDGSALTEADILAACRQRLPQPKSPKVVVFGDAFPVTSTGKYQRSKLKPLFARWRDAQFRAK